ncbi:MAG: macro domain-containing protein [Acidobacteria bacterium]|nr:macro domain-containing protein [Acidobacteriota bacterium]
MRKRFGRIEVEVIKGDITEVKADAIVNAANNHLFMGAGVAGAIKRKGGRVIEKEAVAQGPIPIGEAVVTTAGDLPAKWVIHAAGMGTDFKTDADKISASTRNSLLRAEEKKLTSVAFPAIGTGVGGFPMDECARVMLRQVSEHGERDGSVKKVIFVLYDEPSYRTFLRVFEEEFSGEGS